jgi:RNA polymerase sigma-70 factor, ECF subfamily
VRSPIGIEEPRVNNISDAPNGLRWRVVYSEHADGLFVYLARRVGRDLAEDLLADTFVEAMASVSSFDPERGSMRTWLFGIASNLVRRHWRTEERRIRALARDAASPVTGIDPLLTMTGVVDRVDAATEAEALIDELGRLEEIDRELLALTGWESMSSAEAGAVIGMNAATVRSRVRRARARLRAATEQERGGPS